MKLLLFSCLTNTNFFGFSNPPPQLDTLEEIAEVLNHPLVFSYLHIPVQSGGNSVLKGMNREYTVEEFRKCADTLLELVPDLELATDIICGFPGETEEDHKETMKLVEDYKFPHCHISQFYPRPGTPAARMKRVPTQVVKGRTRQVSALVDSFTDVYKHLEGTVQMVSIVEKAADKVHLVGHTNSYAQILIDGDEDLIGCIALVKVTKAIRWSAFGTLLDKPLSMDITKGAKLRTEALGEGRVDTDSSTHEVGSLKVEPSLAVSFLRETYSKVINVQASYLSNVDLADIPLYIGLGIGIAGMVVAAKKLCM